MEEIKNGNVSNIDGLLAQVASEPVPSFLDTDALDARDIITDDAPEPETVKDVEHQEAPKEEPEVATDDYGMEVTKKERVYTESEVQDMIRDRLSRVKQAPVEPVPAYQTEPAQPVMDNASNESWEAQLDAVIDARLSTREQQRQQLQWQQEQQEQQAQFEVKFNQGAAKYSDFEGVVYGKPLTPQMVLATRGMSDPAAFIYAASKTQASEPKPIDSIKGDVVEKQDRTRNIDDKIIADEQRLRKERARR